MSAPQPPNPPWQGGQPQQQWQGEPNQEQQGQPHTGPHQAPPENPLSAPGPTQALGGPGYGPPHGHPGADGVERTQVVRPEQQGPGDRTQMVPPGTLPPQQPPYAPPPSATDHPHSPPGGFPGQQGPPPGYGPPPPGFGQQPGGFGGPPPGGGFPGQQGPPPGYGPPPGGPPGGFAQQGRLGQGPTFGGMGQNTQMVSMIILGVVALLGLIGAIMAITDLFDLIDASGAASSACDNVPAGPARESCEEFAASADVGVPFRLYIYVILLLAGSLAALGGAVLHYLKKINYGPQLILGGGAAMFLVSFIIGIDGAFAGRVVLLLLFGLVIAAAGASVYFPQTKHFLGGGSVLGGPPSRPSGFGPPPGQPGGFGQPPGGFGGPPPGQPGYGPPPPGYGPPPGQPPGGYGGPPPGGPPPQQW
jgi:hypothetical protein